jgi:eukaryotic-like serine/threonine-protein kinase
MNDLVASPSEVLGRELVPNRLTPVLDEWEVTGEPDAQGYLDRHPEMLADRSFVFSLVFEEYCLRWERGEKPDVEEYCARFPSHRHSLLDALSALQFIEEKVNELEPPPPINWPEPGQTVGDLTLVRELGRGRFARVFLATEASTGNRPVAVKLSLDGPQEARTMGPLDHPHIVPVWSARTDLPTGLSVVCMPYRGEATLEHVLDAAFGKAGARVPARARIILEAASPSGAGREKNLDPVLEQGAYEDGVVRLLEQMASALAFLHARDICHRDLKPSNVLLSPSGQALVLDFNLSVEASVSPRRLGGTLRYMAPEQLRVIRDKSNPALGPQADVFALGVIAYELLTGHHPFEPVPAKGTLDELSSLLLERQLKGAPSPRKHNPRVDRKIAGVIERCLELDPAKRPTAEKIATVSRRHFSMPNRGRRWMTRRPLAALGIAVLLALTVTGGTWGVAVLNAHTAALEKAEEARTEYALGRRLLAEGNYSDADMAFAKSYKLNPDGRKLACMAYCQAVMKNHAQAIKKCDEAIAHGFKSAELYNNRGYSRFMEFGIAFAKQRDEGRAAFQEAADNFEEALRLNPNLYPARYNRLLLTFRRALFEPTWKIPEEPLQDMRPPLQGPVSASLAVHAAYLYAQAAKNRPELRDDIFEHLSLAIELGHDPATLAAEPLFFSLKEDKRFKQLLSSPRKNIRVAPQLNLVDPIPATSD